MSSDSHAFCRAAGDLQLRLCSVPKMSRQNSSLYPSSHGDSDASSHNSSPMSKAPPQQPDSSRRRRTGSDASRFAAEAALQAAINGTSSTTAARRQQQQQQQQQHSSRPAGQGLAADAAAGGPRVSPFAAAQQQAHRHPVGAAMNGNTGSRQESRAWRELQRASMQQELHDRQQQQQQQQQVCDSHQV
jgi:hypothetical protein